MVEKRSFTPVEQHVLQSIYDHLVEFGRWPAFGALQDRLRQDGTELSNVLHGLPSGIVRIAGDLRQPHPDDPVRLSIRAIAACSGGADDVALAFRVLRRAARQDLTGTNAEIGITSRGVARALRLSHTRNAHRFHRVHLILNAERWGQTGSRWTANGWTFSLGADTARFAKVRTVAQFHAVQRQWMSERTASTNRAARRAGTDNGYVKAGIVDKIAGLAGARLDGIRLRQLVLELNDNHRRGNGLAAHAMLRALLDQVPALFGCHNLPSLTERYAFTRTGRSHLNRLRAFRAQVDDTVRGTTGPYPIPTVDDLPHRRAINHLLDCGLRAAVGTAGPAAV